LPIGPTGYGNSPYQSLSSFAGNGLIISSDFLIEEGLLGAAHCEEGRSFPKDAVDHKRVIPFKHKPLEKAWTTFRSKPRTALRLEYERFCVEQANWLEAYALFSAVESHICSKSFEMTMCLNGLRGFVKSKSHPAVTAPAFREYSPRYRNDPMGMSVIFSVEFIVNHIVDTRGRYLISWLKFMHVRTDE